MAPPRRASPGTHKRRAWRSFYFLIAVSVAWWLVVVLSGLDRVQLVALVVGVVVTVVVLVVARNRRDRPRQGNGAPK